MKQGWPKIGTRLHGGLSARDCVAVAQGAEQAGLSAVWFAENPFNRGVMPSMTACALQTSRIDIGVGVWNPYNRHPTLIAMEIGAFDELCGGRARLGIGSGIGAAVERMGLSYAKPIGALRDTFAIVRGLLKGESVTYDGAVFSAKDVRLEYPVPRPDMPIYMAATGDQALRICGAIADGLMISNMSPPGFTSRAMAILRESAARAGRPAPAHVVQYMPCVVRHDRKEARQIVKRTIGSMLCAYWKMGGRAPATRQALYRDGTIPFDEFEAALVRIEQGESPEAVLDDRFVDGYGLAGDPDDCKAGIARYAEVGVTELVLTFVGGEPLRDMALFGRSVGLIE